MSEKELQNLKHILRENDIPFFTDEELNFYFVQNKCDFNATAFQCLIIKSENTTLNISGLSAADSSDYFRRLAQMYRPNNSQILKA